MMKKRATLAVACLTMAMALPFGAFAEGTTQTGTDNDAALEVGQVYTPQTKSVAADTTTPAATVTVTPAPVVTVEPTAAPAETTTTTPATTTGNAAATAPQVSSVPGVTDWLEPAVGEWYDTNGQLAMTITESAINNCPVTALTDMTLDYPRTGRFTVAQADGEKTIKLDLLGHKSHQYLIVNDRTPLRRSINGDHYETVGNFYLGMTKQDLVNAYGQPASVTPDQGAERWAYSTPHVDVLLQGNLVMAVRVYSDSNLTFAQSGLTATSTPDEYAKAYGLTTVPTIPEEAGALSPAYNLPQGERLHFGQGFVELSVF